MKRLPILGILLLLLTGCCLAQAKKSRATSSNLNIRKVNFKSVKYNVGSKYDLQGVTQKDLRVISTKFGDLDGDGADEAAVHILYSMERYGGNGYGYFVELFTVAKGKLKVLARLEGGGKSSEFQIKLVNIVEGQLVIKQCEMTAPTYDEYLATVKYEWNGDQLVEVNRARTKVENCWN